MRKRVPNFWWDFNEDDVIVESDEPQYPILARWPIVGKDAMPEIERAEKLIADLESGRVTLKQAWAELRGKP